MGKSKIINRGDMVHGIMYISDVEKKDRKCLFRCHCGNEFVASLYNISTKNTKSCGCMPTRVKMKRERHLVLCACGCGELLNNLDSRGRKAVFIHGHNKGNFGNEHTEATRKIMNEKKIGIPLTLAHRIKIGEQFKGERHPNWQGGLTKEADKIRKSIPYKCWRLAVFTRDGFRCTSCLEKEKVSGKLEAHHVKPSAHFPELRFDVNNGVTLCKDCHKLTDTYLHKGRYYNKTLK